MILRRATADDAAAIAEAEERIFPDAWSYSDVMGTIVASGALCFVVRGDEGDLLAYVLGRSVAPEGEIYRLATLPEYRRRNIAYRLLDYAVKTERGGGLETFFLEVRAQNLPARRLYASYGFKELGRRKNYYRAPTDDAVLMMKTDSLKI